jgi:hypothetical protein
VKQIIPFLLSIFLATPLWADYTLSITATNGTVILDPAGGTYADGTVVWLTPIPSAGYYFSGWSGDARGKAVAARLVVNSNKSVTANFAAWTPPVGIPTPTFGITQTYRMYDDPANRNVALTYHESASGGFYTHYVDNTDEDATDTLPGGGTNPGTVDLPRLTLPLRLSAYIPNAGAGWLPAGSVIEVHGGPYEMSGFTSSTKGPACYADASVDQPIFIRGVGNPHLKATTTTNIGAQWWIYGRGLVIEGFYFDQTCLWLSGYNSFPVQNPEYIAIRNNQMVGTPLDATYSAIKVSPLASAAIYANHITVYGNDIGYYGDAEYDLDSDGDNSDDVMGFVASPHTEYVWITDNYIHHNGGDSIHLGISAARTVRNIYIGRNHMRSDRENAVDIKQCQDIIVSQNVMHDYLQKGRPDDGLGVSIHEGTLAANTCPYQIWILYNDIYDCGYAGIATMSSDEVYIIGNIVHDVKGPTTNPSLHCKAFSAFGFTGTEHHYYIENTVYNCQAGYMLLMNSANSVYLANNIVDTLTDGTESSWENHIGITNYTSNATIENCLLYEAGGQAKFWWGSVAKTLAEMQALGQCNGCLEADPQFADADNDDFHLQPTSPAIDAGTSAGVVQEVSNRFEQLYGLDIRKDTEGKARTDAWEIGAYEYVLTPISDLAVSRTSQNSITLTWTVPGERGVTGTPTGYDIRYSSNPPTEANWSTATQVAGEPAAGGFGAPQSFTITGLTPGVTYYIAITVRDAAGHASALSNVVSATTSTTGNHAPVLTPVGDRSVVETETLTFSVSATDADGDLLTYSTGTLPAGATFTAATQTFAWTPTSLQSGRYPVMFQVNDGQVNVSQTITITVLSPEITVAVAPLAVAEDGATNMVFTFTRSAVAGSPLMVNFSAAGTATYGTDYAQTGAASFTATAGTVWIAAGQTAAQVTVDPTQDGAVESDETVILTVTMGTGYTIGIPAGATGTILNAAAPALNWDIDDNGRCDALTDGLLITRYLFGFRGDTLIADAVAPDANRSTAADIEAYLAFAGSAGMLDIDGNGADDALTDGLLTTRYLFGFRGDALIDSAVAADATRTTAAQIEAFLASYMPIYNSPPVGNDAPVLAATGNNNANEAPATIQLSNSTVIEKQPVGTVVGKFSAKDPDSGDTFTYSLVSGKGGRNNDSFRISGNTLQTAASFIYQGRSNHTIRVRATDSGGLVCECVFTITIVGGNQTPTAIQLSNSSVLENQPAGTTVGKFSTIDPDSNDAFTYTLVTNKGQEDGNSFTISGNTLLTAVSFDYEAKSSYNIHVRTTDSGGLTCEQTFTILVLDQSDIDYWGTEGTDTFTVMNSQDSPLTVNIFDFHPEQYDRIDLRDWVLPPSTAFSNLAMMEDEQTSDTIIKLSEFTTLRLVGFPLVKLQPDDFIF